MIRNIPSHDFKEIILEVAPSETHNVAEYLADGDDFSFMSEFCSQIEGYFNDESFMFPAQLAEIRMVFYKEDGSPACNHCGEALQKWVSNTSLSCSKIKLEVVNAAVMDQILSPSTTFR